MAASGCGRDLPEKIIPYVVQPNEIIPGIAAWYSGACSECSAGCGVLVRTREGRAVKIEGNSEHPVNSGGLCALGQSALQTLYDPDRVREPLERAPNSGPFKPVSWKSAIDVIAATVKDLPVGKEVVLLTQPLSGSLLLLVNELVDRLKGFRHVTYDTSGQDVLDLAAEQSFGAGVRTAFDFSKADVVLSVGAGYLESWVSPVEFSNQWATRRRPESGKKVSECIHVEPRLSLTAANADRWIKNAPGGESAFLLAVLAEVVMLGGGKQLSADERSYVQSIINKNNVHNAQLACGVTIKDIKRVAKKLLSAKSSLVVAGGAATGGAHAVDAAVLANVLNVVLANVGRSVRLLSRNVEAQSSHVAMKKLIQEMSGGRVAALLIAGLNPAYTLSSASGFREAVAKIDRVISITTNLDETANLAHTVLPLSTNIESWTDSETRPGVLNLNQPAMQPLYPTQSLGDSLLAIAAALDLKFDNATSFYEYIRAQWKKRTGDAGFDGRWTKYVEKGGSWSARPSSVKRALSAGVTRARATESTTDELKLLVFPTINSKDGSSANRPWLQELPAPITTAVWGSWVEMHTSRAESLGVKTGTVVQVRTADGATEAPAYVTNHIHPSLIAIPIGQGHTTLGRYANGIGANALALLTPGADNATASITPVTMIRPALGANELVMTQMERDQHGRGILRTVSVKEFKQKSADNEKNGHRSNGHGNAHGAGHHDPLALGPQAAPPQMYEQMEHVRNKWGMSIDLAACTGCSACVVACYAENNVPVVGREFCAEGREMSWVRVSHYVDEQNEEQPVAGFQPMMCQHCGNAPCEPVCPVYATYHNEDGLNAMLYNRCVGTRYCSNNCSYKVRRFNWFHYTYPEPLNLQLNPDVTVREVGVMEKCTFCVQRIREGVNTAKNDGRMVADGEIQPACASSCPTKAIRFGNLKDESSMVFKDSNSSRGYKVLDSHINTQPAITYLAKVTRGEAPAKKHGEH